ncbi:hypothetical protein [Blastococcus brunescens]|uniref:Uncharacterized protein n=1 Tax=Blastococcus brunescens TaxID=1564165 RepID=A0ABZ1AY54_9ACTN|nr:hypothetical protein [Blastococcus sp. BMG 8361]WRL63440.1 hypothetical protein U6N30_27545 [Blastococcus sp. BMG 8361]
MLPTLGEVDVDQTTVADLTARVPVRADDLPGAAVLKGDARMAAVLRRALWGRSASPPTRSRCRCPGAGTACRSSASSVTWTTSADGPAPTTTSSSCTTRPAGSG